MARKKTPNKSAAIRKYVAKNPAASAKEVIAALAKQGLDVTPGFIYNIKSRTPTAKKVSKKGAGVKKKRSGRKKAARKRAVRTQTALLSAADLMEAKKLVDKLGSTADARKALETLAQLQ